MTKKHIAEMARAGACDPYAYPREIVIRDEKPAVLERVVEMSGWGEALPDGWGRGLACYSYFTSQEPTEVAHDAEVSVWRTTIPSVAPAVANAVFDATGIRVRHLPIQPADLAP